MSTTQRNIDRISAVVRWSLHLMVAALIILVLWRAGHWSVRALGVVFALIYFWGALPGSALHRRPLLWFSMLTLVWVGLIWDGPEPAYLAFPLFFIIVMITTPVLAALFIAVITGIAVSALAAHLGWSVGVVTGPVLGALVAWIMGTSFSLLTRTVKELVDARAAAIEASKSAGELAERARIAGEIHDTVAQGLSSIQMLLHVVEQRVSDPEALDQIRLARRTTAENLAEIRNIIAALQPQPLVGADLPVALARVASTTPMGEAISFAVDGQARDLPSLVEAEIVRIAQTLVGNVIQHSHADSAKITLTYQPDQILLDVLDNGLGFDPGSLPRRDSIGLPTAHRRAEELGGTLIIESVPGGGTGVSLRIPTPERSTS